MSYLEEARRTGMSDRAFGVAVGLGALPLFLGFALSGQAARGRAAAISAAMIVVVARFTWDQRKCIWYWLTLSCFVIAHTAVVLLATWQERSYPGFTLLPVAAADFGAMYGLIRFIEALVKARNNRFRKDRRFDKDSRY